jgi:hypothetical protein
MVVTKALQGAIVKVYSPQVVEMCPFTTQVPTALVIQQEVAAK